MDLRAFIDRLSTDGRLRRVTTPSDWRFEIGKMIREERTPLLFENIKDYPGQRLFSNGLVDSSCIGTALHLGTSENVIQAARKRVHTPIAPLMVADGPVQENSTEGETIDFLKFPIPHWHPEDVARYIGT